MCRVVRNLIGPSEKLATVMTSMIPEFQFKSRPTKRKLLIGRLFLILSVALSTPATVAAFDTSRPLCPPQWGEYVQQIQLHINLAELKEPIVFVSRNGVAFDCLDLGLDQTFLAQVEIWEKSLPFDRTRPLDEDHRNWPVNICSSGTADWPSISYRTVYLPIQQDILEQEICKTRVMSITSRLGEE